MIPKLSYADLPKAKPPVTRVFQFGLGRRPRVRRSWNNGHFTDDFDVLPAGTVVDAEIVVMNGQRPNFNRVMIRDRAGRAKTIAALVRTLAAKFIAWCRAWWVTWLKRAAIELPV